MSRDFREGVVVAAEPLAKVDPKAIDERWSTGPAGLNPPVSSFCRE